MIKDEFLRQIRMLVEFWENNEKCNTIRERLDGLAFSILYLLDGKSSEVQNFMISPDNTKDKENISGNLSDSYFLKKE